MPKNPRGMKFRYKMLAGEPSNGDRTTKGDQGHCGVLYYQCNRLQAVVFQGLGCGAATVLQLGGVTFVKH